MKVVSFMVVRVGCNQNSFDYDQMNRQYLRWLLVLFLLASIKSQGSEKPTGCYQSNYTSTATKCDMTFLFCFSNRILKQCSMRQCSRYVRAGDCFLWTSFPLDNSSCFTECCGSSTFDQPTCTAYNLQQESRQQSIQVGFIVLFVIIAVALCLVVAWFSHKHLRCCDKTEPFRIIKFNIKWRRDEYLDCKCEVCHTYGPLMVTSCHHYFHLSCFQESAKNMKCPHCQVPIKERIKIYCFNCRQFSFKAKVYRIEDISEAIAEAKGLHFDLCPKTIQNHRQMGQLVESERTF